MDTRFIIVERLGSGFAAVCYWQNKDEPELGPFWEPWQTGIGRYTNEEEAEEEAMNWAFAEDIKYIPRGEAQPAE